MCLWWGLRELLCPCLANRTPLCIPGQIPLALSVRASVRCSALSSSTPLPVSLSQSFLAEASHTCWLPENCCSLPILLIHVLCEIQRAGAGHLPEPEGPWQIRSIHGGLTFAMLPRPGSGGLSPPALLFPHCCDKWSFSPGKPSSVTHRHRSVTTQTGAPAAMCAGDRKTLVTHLTAEERLFLVRRDHPLENEARQEPSRSNVLWLPGDTIESAAANGNLLVTGGSRDLPGTSQLWASLTHSLSHQRSSKPPARPLLGLAGEHLGPNACGPLVALRRQKHGEECSWHSSLTLGWAFRPRIQAATNSERKVSSSVVINAPSLPL